MTLPSLTVQQQGVGSVSADDINSKVGWAPTVSFMRSIVGLDTMAIWVEGTDAPNDGGQGMFYWDGVATAPDDDGATTIQPNGVTGPGRWIRQAIAPEGSIPLSQLQTIPANTLLGNNTGSTGPVTALTIAQVVALLSITTTGVPTGAIMCFGASVPPTGWLVCNGSNVSRTTYAALFAVIGTTFGIGDGTTTFGLPNMLGQFARGWDSGGTVDPGRTFGTGQESALQSHVHISDTPSVFVNGGYTDPFGDSGVPVLRVGFDTAGTGDQNLGLTNDGTTYSSFDPNPAGQVSATETRPTNVALAFCIKT